GVASTSGVPDSETDSGVGADSDGTDPGEGSQPASVSEQAAVLGLLWIGGGDAVECGLSFSRGTGGEAGAGTNDDGVGPRTSSIGSRRYSRVPLWKESIERHLTAVTPNWWGKESDRSWLG